MTTIALYNGTRFNPNATSLKALKSLAVELWTVADCAGDFDKYTASFGHRGKKETWIAIINRLNADAVIATVKKETLEIEPTPAIASDFDNAMSELGDLESREIEETEFWIDEIAKIEPQRSVRPLNTIELTPAVHRYVFGLIFQLPRAIASTINDLMFDGNHKGIRETLNAYRPRKRRQRFIADMARLEPIPSF